MAIKHSHTRHSKFGVSLPPQGEPVYKQGNYTLIIILIMIFSSFVFQANKAQNTRRYRHSRKSWKNLQLRDCMYVMYVMYRVLMLCCLYGHPPQKNIINIPFVRSFLLLSWSTWTFFSFFFFRFLLRLVSNTWILSVPPSLSLSLPLSLSLSLSLSLRLSRLLFVIKQIRDKK